MKKNQLFRMMCQLLGLVVFSCWTLQARASFIALSHTNYLQDFDSLLPKKGKSSDLPQGWSLAEFGKHADDKIRADDGSKSTGGIYSYGSKGSTDRALGSLRGADGTYGLFGTSFQNSSDAIINSLNLSFTGEEWRLGAQGRQDRLQFQYSLNASSLTSGTWLNAPQLDFLTPNTIGVGAHDGNLVVNQKQISGTINFLSIPSGGTFWIRWVDAPVAGGGPEDGLAVDNFSISAVPETSTWLAGLAALGALGLFSVRLTRSLGIN